MPLIMQYFYCFKAFKALSYWVFVLFYLFFPACPKKPNKTQKSNKTHWVGFLKKTPGFLTPVKVCSAPYQRRQTERPPTSSASADRSPSPSATWAAGTWVRRRRTGFCLTAIPRWCPAAGHPQYSSGVRNGFYKFGSVSKTTAVGFRFRIAACSVSLKLQFQFRIASRRQQHTQQSQRVVSITTVF